MGLQSEERQLGKNGKTHSSTNCKGLVQKQGVKFDKVSTLVG